MTSAAARAASRRFFLQFLAASPLLAADVRKALAEDGLKVPARLPDPFPWAPQGANGPIKSPNEALDVFDFEAVAYKNVPPAHFGYMTSGANSDATLRINRDDFAKFALRPRRLRDVSHVDGRITLFGTTWASPVFICPTGGNKSIHPDGEIAVSKAAEAGRHLQMFSTMASVSIEEAIQARGGTPIWFQLYPLSDFDLTKSLVARVERAGSQVLVITVDGGRDRKDETFERMKRMDSRDCTGCHETAAGGGSMTNRKMFSEMDPARAKNIIPALATGTLTWDFVRRLRDTTKMKVILKGIIAPEDAALCVKYGFDGVHVSNHGGRNEDTGTSTIGILSEVAAAVGGKIPILVDSGFRRGMDVAKALAMGATAVGIGRPYLWGLGAFGQPGVEKVLEILRTETEVAMGQLGAATVKDLVPAMVHKI